MSADTQVRGWRATVDFTFAAGDQDDAGRTFAAVRDAIREIAHPEGGEFSPMAPNDVIEGSPLALDIAADSGDDRFAVVSSTR